LCTPREANGERAVGLPRYDDPAVPLDRDGVGELGLAEVDLGEASSCECPIERSVGRVTENAEVPVRRSVQDLAGDEHLAV